MFSTMLHFAVSRSDIERKPPSRSAEEFSHSRSERRPQTDAMEAWMHKQLIIGGTQIRTNEAGLVSLNDIYSAASAAVES